MATSKPAVPQKDKFGTERYEAAKAELKKLKVSKEFQQRFDKAESVFLYRRDVHHQLHNAELDTGWYAHRGIEEIKVRLSAFKPVEFFIDTMLAIVEEVKKEIAGELAAKMAKKQPLISRGWGAR